MHTEERILDFLEASEDDLKELAKEIWEHPELALQEVYASKLIANQLEQANFHVRMGVGRLPTAFVADWGKGKPIIGILASTMLCPAFRKRYGLPEMLWKKMRQAMAVVTISWVWQALVRPWQSKRPCKKVGSRGQSDTMVVLLKRHWLARSLWPEKGSLMIWMRPSPGIQAI
jgi:hypothetical protein